MMLPIIAVALCFTTCLAIDADLKGDGNIYSAVIDSLQQLKVQRADVVQRASSVCYDELGCFDKDGTFKHLKQLPEPPESVNTQFLLYTKKNPTKPQILDYKNPDTILQSNIDKTKPFKFITHGFAGKNMSIWVIQMKDAFMKMQDVNLIVVDWSLGARAPYYRQACVNTELVGAEVAVMYYFMKDNLGIQEKDLHLIGFSLGAHVVGFVGKRMKQMRGTRPGRTTGLDPANLFFEDYGSDVHLYKDDADFVDIIHTNADSKIHGGVGIRSAIGHVDFFPNGGKRQPGCLSTIEGAFKDIVGKERLRTCNHERAAHLYTDSILHPDSCRFVGYKCDDYDVFSKGQCLNCGDDCGHMGYNVKGSGTYYLLTSAKQPFCTHIAKVNIRFAKNIKKSYGSIIITLEGADDSRVNFTLTDTDEKLLPGEERSAVVALSSDMEPLKSVEALYLRYNGFFVEGHKTYTIDHVSIEDIQHKSIFKTCEENILLNHNEYRKLVPC